MTIHDIPEEIAQAIYKTAYTQGFQDAQRAPSASPQALTAKRQKAYQSWLVKLHMQRQLRAKQQRLIDPRMPHATVVPLMGK